MKKKLALLLAIALTALLAFNVFGSKHTDISLNQPAPFPENI
jgi:hypothetical protein